MFKNILVVEDNTHKLEKIVKCIEDELPDSVISVAKSFTSGVRLAVDQAFDLLVIDMSLPTYDRTSTESGGRNRPFGGKEMARKIIRRNSASKLVFITQYGSFSDHGRTFTFETLKEDVKKECAEHFLGFIMYDSSMVSWKSELLEVLRGRGL